MLRTETIALSCLSPQQAADLINPYIRLRGSAYWVPSKEIPAITIRAGADELAKARELIREFENNPAAACHAPAGTIRGFQSGDERATSGPPRRDGPTGSPPDKLPPPQK
jgi:hypothetical protein